MAAEEMSSMKMGGKLEQRGTAENGREERGDKNTQESPFSFKTTEKTGDGEEVAVEPRQDLTEVRTPSVCCSGKGL